MVYFKVNRRLARVIQLAGMAGKSAISCTKHCDKQLISLEHIDICLEAIRRKVAELEKKVEEQKMVTEAEQLAASPESTPPVSKEDV